MSPPEPREPSKGKATSSPPRAPHEAPHQTPLPSKDTFLSGEEQTPPVMVPHGRSSTISKDTSDSFWVLDEAFVSKSNPSEESYGIRSARHHSTPSATSIISRVEQYGARSKAIAKGEQHSVVGKRGMKFAKYNSNLDGEYGGRATGRGAGRTVSIARHHNANQAQAHTTPSFADWERETLTTSAFKPPGKPTLSNQYLSHAPTDTGAKLITEAMSNSERSSTSEKHQCPHCDLAFTRHHNLKSHLLSHSDEKPYICLRCQRRFRRVADLKSHTNLHNEEILVFCPRCRQKFARSDALAWRHYQSAGGCALRRDSTGSIGAGEHDKGSDLKNLPDSLEPGGKADLDRILDQRQDEERYDQDRVKGLQVESRIEVEKQVTHEELRLQSRREPDSANVEMKMLLDKNADVNTHSELYGNAFQAASAKGHEKVVQMLLDKNADMDTHGGEYDGALQAASLNGHVKVVPAASKRYLHSPEDESNEVAPITTGDGPSKPIVSEAATAGSVVRGAENQSQREHENANEGTTEPSKRHPDASKKESDELKPPTIGVGPSEPIFSEAATAGSVRRGAEEQQDLQDLPLQSERESKNPNDATTTESRTGIPSDPKPSLMNWNLSRRATGALRPLWDHQDRVLEVPRLPVLVPQRRIVVISKPSRLGVPRHFRFLDKLDKTFIRDDLDFKPLLSGSTLPASIDISTEEEIVTLPKESPELSREASTVGSIYPWFESAWSSLYTSEYPDRKFSGPSFLSICLREIASFPATFSQAWKSLLGEPLLERGKVRVRWTCRCGQKLYDDFEEIVPGGAKNLAKSLDHSSDSYIGRLNIAAAGPTGGSKTGAQLESNPESSNQSSISQAPSKGSGPGSYPAKPVLEVRKDDINTVSCQAADQETQFQLTCVRISKYATSLLQLDLKQPARIVSDRQLLELLRTNYYEIRSSWRRRLLSFQTLTSIEFVQFELHRKALVDIRKRNDIPPSSRKDEYDYSPVPAEVIPPVGKNYLMHIYHHPEDADQEIVCLERFPKRVKDRLKLEQPALQIGWGIEFVEGIHWNKVWCFGFVIVVLSLDCMELRQEGRSGRIRDRRVHDGVLDIHGGDGADGVAMKLRARAPTDVHDNIKARKRCTALENRCHSHLEFFWKNRHYYYPRIWDHEASRYEII